MTMHTPSILAHTSTHTMFGQWIASSGNCNGMRMWYGKQFFTNQIYVSTSYVPLHYIICAHLALTDAVDVRRFSSLSLRFRSLSVCVVVCRVMFFVLSTFRTNHNTYYAKIYNKHSDWIVCILVISISESVESEH